MELQNTEPEPASIKTVIRTWDPPAVECNTLLQLSEGTYFLTIVHCTMAVVSNT